MTLDELALMIAKDILVFKWMFVPGVRCVRIWTIVNKTDEIIDVRDITYDELYETETSKYLREYMKELKDDKVSR